MPPHPTANKTTNATNALSTIIISIYKCSSYRTQQHFSTTHKRACTPGTEETTQTRRAPRVFTLSALPTTRHTYSSNIHSRSRRRHRVCLPNAYIQNICAYIYAYIHSFVPPHPNPIPCAYPIPPLVILTIEPTPPPTASRFARSFSVHCARAKRVTYILLKFSKIYPLSPSLSFARPPLHHNTHCHMLTAGLCARLARKLAKTYTHRA